MIRMSVAVSVCVTHSTADTDHYFSGQIIGNAKFHLQHFANTAEYRSRREGVLNVALKELT